MGLVLEHLPRIAKTIDSHGEALRIRKMLYCLAKQVWENDPNVVNRCSSEQLLGEVIQTRPTLKRLVLSLQGLVKTLNRQEVYAPLAKDIVRYLAPVYQTPPNEVDDQAIQQIIEDKEKTERKDTHSCINLMELLVKEEAYKELQKLPVNVVKFVSLAEVSAYALNRLPSLYVSSEEGKHFQLKKAEGMQEMIRSAVLQGIGAVMRDPIRKATPLNLCAIDSFSTAFNLLLDLENFVNHGKEKRNKISLGELSEKVSETIRSYEVSLKDLENFLRLQHLSEEPLTARNLASTVRKVIRRLLTSKGGAGSKNLRTADQYRETTQEVSEQEVAKRLDAQETMIVNFTESGKGEKREKGDDSDFATSIRDWYSF